MLIVTDSPSPCLVLRKENLTLFKGILLPNQALDIQPSDKGCLVSRSKCYLKLGDPHNALKDAEAALEEDKEFNKVRLSNAIL